MLVEVAADHFAVFGPLVVGVERGVNADEAFAVFLDERHHVGLLAVVHVEFGGGAGEDDQVEVVEVLGVVAELLFGEELGVRAQHGVPQAALLAHLEDGVHGRGNGVVLEALGLPDDEDVLEVNRLGVRRGRDGIVAVGLGAERKRGKGERKDAGGQHGKRRTISPYRCTASSLLRVPESRNW